MLKTQGEIKNKKDSITIKCNTFFCGTIPVTIKNKDILYKNEEQQKQQIKEKSEEMCK